VVNVCLEAWYVDQQQGVLLNASVKKGQDAQDERVEEDKRSKGSRRGKEKGIALARGNGSQAISICTIPVPGASPACCLRRPLFKTRARPGGIKKRRKPCPTQGAPSEDQRGRDYVCLTIRWASETRIEGLLLLGPQFKMFLALCGGTLRPGTCVADKLQRTGTGGSNTLFVVADVFAAACSLRSSDRVAVWSLSISVAIIHRLAVVSRRCLCSATVAVTPRPQRWIARFSKSLRKHSVVGLASLIWCYLKRSRYHRPRPCVKSCCRS
jgi:hypothetical protein